MGRKFYAIGAHSFSHTHRTLSPGMTRPAFVAPGGGLEFGEFW